MKSKIVGFSLSLIAVVFFSAYNNGITTPPNGQNRTGAGGSQADCSGSGCHSVNKTDLQLNITACDLVTGAVVTQYTPNYPYKIRIYGNYSSSGTFPKFSFQFAATQQNGLGAGIYFNTAGLQANTIGIFEIVEPYQAKPTVMNKCIDSVNWIAPSKNSGKVTLYETVLEANGDGFATGDIANNTSHEIDEGPSGINDLPSTTVTTIFPNPAHDEINLLLEHAEIGNYSLLILSQYSSLIHQETIEVNNHSYQQQMDMNNFAPGNYVLFLCKDNNKRMLRFTKF